MTVRRAALGLIAASILLTTVGCDELQTKFSGKKDQGPLITALRKSIADFRARFMTAVSGSERGTVSGLIQEGNRLLDQVDQQAALMSFMDGQAIKITEPRSAGTRVQCRSFRRDSATSVPNRWTDASATRLPTTASTALPKIPRGGS